MFQVPPPTRFDLNFSLFGFSVRISPFFWVLAVFLGASSFNLERIAIWVAVIFVSILIHELGHALVMRRYDIDSFIVLYHFGGLAVPLSARRMSLGWLQQIAISLAGPFAGFFFVGIVIGIVELAGGLVFTNPMFGFLPVPMAYLFSAGDLVNEAIATIVWVNVFWGILNLLPVFPLDGGRVSQQIFMRFDRWNGLRNALWLSVVTGALLAIVGYVYFNSLYMAFMFGLLAVQSYQMIQGGVGPRF